MNRHLGVVLGLLATATVVATMPRAVDDVGPEVRLHQLPLTTGSWSATIGVPPLVLPPDPGALESAQYTYTSAGRTVWFTAARYPSDDPARRPARDRLLLESAYAEATHDLLAFEPNGPSGSPLLLGRMALSLDQQPVTIIYWYQLGTTVLTGDYQLRLHLFLDSLMGRRRALTLFRVASEVPGSLPPFLRALPLVRAHPAARLM